MVHLNEKVLMGPWAPVASEHMITSYQVAGYISKVQCYQMGTAAIQCDGSGAYRAGLKVPRGMSKSNEQAAQTPMATNSVDLTLLL